MKLGYDGVALGYDGVFEGESYSIILVKIEKSSHGHLQIGTRPLSAYLGR